MKTYQQIASSLEAMRLTKAPSGSGFDAGTTLNYGTSTGNKLVFNTSFHHMDEFGGYDGWTEHSVTVKPDFVSGFDLSISGPDRNSIKDYMVDVFNDWLNQDAA